MAPTRGTRAIPTALRVGTRGLAASLALGVVAVLIIVASGADRASDPGWNVVGVLLFVLAFLASIAFAIVGLIGCTLWYEDRRRGHLSDADAADSA